MYREPRAVMRREIGEWEEHGAAPADTRFHSWPQPVSAPPLSWWIVSFRPGAVERGHSGHVVLVWSVRTWCGGRPQRSGRSGPGGQRQPVSQQRDRLARRRHRRRRRSSSDWSRRAAGGSNGGHGWVPASPVSRSSCSSRRGLPQPVEPLVPAPGPLGPLAVAMSTRPRAVRHLPPACEPFAAPPIR